MESVRWRKRVSDNRVHTEVSASAASGSDWWTWGQSRGGRADEPATHLGRLRELPGSDEVAGLGQAHLGDVLVMAAEELLVMTVSTRERVRR
jgi:hypothetical protein